MATPRSAKAPKAISGPAKFRDRICNLGPSRSIETDWNYTDALGASVLAAPAALPSSVNLRRAWWSINDQGGTGSCVGWACADGLLQAWDEAVASKRPFANMPEDGGGFPAKLGALYVAYADAADDAPTGIAGVTEVEIRARDRYPSDQATLEDLRLQREALARRR